MNKVEQWKQEKHGFDVWDELLQYAARATPMRAIDDAELERMKWYGVFYRKRDGEGTYMLRLRVTGGELTAAQAKAAAYVAYEFGYGILDITTRANLQIQGLPIDKIPQALARLEATGLTARQTGHDNVRNVFGHALSGLDPDELIDTRPLCRQITEIFLADRGYADLPRKFNIAINGRQEHAAHFWSQDLSFLACRDAGGEVAFQVLVGGTQGQNPCLAAHLPVLVAPHQVVAATRALLDLFRQRGSRERRDQARFRYLLEQIGVGGVLDELHQRLAFPLLPCVREPTPPAGYDDLVGWFRQRQAGLWAMGLSVSVGRLSWQQLEGLAIASARWGDGQLRLTPEQGILVVDIPSGFRDAVAAAAARHGLSPNADSLARNTVACTGRQFCNIGVTETKGIMLQLIERLRLRGVILHGIRIHMSGCPSSCAQHHTADIGLKGVRVRRLLGTREGFDVYLGGGVAGQIHLGRPYKFGVDVSQLPQLIDEVVSEYYLKHKPGQTFSMYWRELLRDQEALRAGEDEYSPPTWLCEGCGYRHGGEDPPLFCPKCAGLRRLFARLEEGLDQQPSPSAQLSSPARDDGFVPAAAEAAIPADKPLVVTIDSREYALARVAGEVRAFDNACPHEGASLAQGTVEQGCITCPWHGWRFDLATARSVDPEGESLSVHPVLVENGQVYIRPAAASVAR